jgi:hypothetical protein
MAVSLIALAAGICWIALFTFAWLLCRAAKLGDENCLDHSVPSMSDDRLPSVAQRR